MKFIQQQAINNSSIVNLTNDQLEDVSGGFIFQTLAVAAICYSLYVGWRDGGC